MRKSILNYFYICILVSNLLLFLSCDVETNDTEDEHYGKVIVHNEVSSGETITRITISDTYFNPTTYYNEKVYVSAGKSSNEYKLELFLIYDILFHGYNVTITLDNNTTKSKTILAYEDIVNHLYYNGTDLVERN